MLEVRKARVRLDYMSAMDPEGPGLTVDQVRDRVLTALAARRPSVRFRLPEHATLVREFGWVFALEPINETTAFSTEKVIPRLALVHKTTGQAVATSRSYTPEQFATVFERLLARSYANARNWCLTLDGQFAGKRIDIADDARAVGLEELAGALDPSV
jgi:hypothetical protein